MAYRQASPFVDQFFDTNGLPLSGGTIKSYLAGTTTATSMYTDSSGTSAGSSITLNVRGEPEVSGNTINIWLDEGVTYKFVLADSSGTSIWTVDNINVGFAGGSIDIQDTNPLINFKTGATESFDTRIAQITNGLGFYTGGNAQTVLGMFLDQNRNLLLDPAGAGGAPAAPLHVKGATADYPIKVESTDGTAGVQLSDNATTGVVGIAAVGDNAILKGSNVGIGTDSPQSGLHVKNNTGVKVSDSALARHLNITPALADGTPAIIESTPIPVPDPDFMSESGMRLNVAGNGPLEFYTNNTESMRLTEAGNLLLGTTSVSVSQGGIGLITGNLHFLSIGHASSTASGNPYATFDFAGNRIGSITQNGTTGVLYNTSSDERLKENITNSADAGSKVDAIRIRQFDWKADGSHQDYGVIAQELVTVAPEAVNQPIDPDDMMGVDYSKLVPMLVKEIQSLRSRVAELEKN